MEKTINLEKILFNNIDKLRIDIPDNILFSNEAIKKSIEYNYFINAMREAVKQALELAAENLRQTSGQFNSDYTDEKRRILNTINKVI